MKKLLVSLFALVLLAGCGGGSGSDSSKSMTCDFDEDMMGIPMSVEIKEADGKLGTLIYTITYEGVAEGATDAEIDQVKEEFDEMAEEEYGDYDALDAKMEIDGDDMIMIVSIDIQKSDSLPSEFNTTGSTLDQMKEMDYDDMVKELKATDDIKCKEN